MRGACACEMFIESSTHSPARSHVPLTHTTHTCRHTRDTETAPETDTGGVTAACPLRPRPLSAACGAVWRGAAVRAPPARATAAAALRIRSDARPEAESTQIKRDKNIGAERQVFAGLHIVLLHKRGTQYKYCLQRVGVRILAIVSVCWCYLTAPCYCLCAVVVGCMSCRCVLRTRVRIRARAPLLEVGGDRREHLLAHAALQSNQRAPAAGETHLGRDGGGNRDRARGRRGRRGRE